MVPCLTKAYMGDFMYEFVSHVLAIQNFFKL